MSILNILGASVTKIETNWIATYNTSAVLDVGNSIAISTTGNVYTTGTTSSGGIAPTVFVTKHSQTGILQWSYTFDKGSTADYGLSVAVDSLENVYITTGHSDIAIITKLNSDGTFVWERSCSTSPLTAASKFIVKVSNDIVYIVGCFSTEGVLVKYNTNGDFITAVDINYLTINGIAIDSSGNLFLATATGLIKLNSNNEIEFTITNAVLNGVVLGSDNSIFTVGTANSNIFVAKYSSTGQTLWEYQLDSGFIDAGNGIAVDESDNIYITGIIKNTTVTNSACFIRKYSASGVVSWTRQLDVSSVPDTGNSIAVDTEFNFYLTGQINTTTASACFVAKLPKSGTIPLTGTYSVGGFTINYSSITLTVVSSALSVYSLPKPWLMLDYSTAAPYAEALDIDSSGMYSAMNDGSGDAGAMKVVTNDIVWQTKTSSTTTQIDAHFYAGLDRLGGFYTAGYHNGTTANARYASVTKYNTNTGAVIWHKGFDTASINDTAAAIAVNSTTCVIAGTTSATNGSAFVAALKLDGTAKYSIRLDTATTSDYIDALAINSANEVYVATETSTNGCVLSKLADTTGSLLWQRSLTNIFISDLCIDSSGNIYAISSDYATTAYKAVLTKYDSSGTLIWARRLSNSNATYKVSGLGICIDSLDNVYITTYIQLTSTAYCIGLVSYNSLGTLLWQNKLNFSASNTETAQKDSQVYYEGYVYFFATPSSGTTYLVRLPANGTIPSYTLPTNVNYTVGDLVDVDATSLVTPVTKTVPWSSSGPSSTSPAYSTPASSGSISVYGTYDPAVGISKTTNTATSLLTKSAGVGSSNVLSLI